MSVASLNLEPKQIDGFDSIIIVKDLSDIPGGVTLDVTGITANTISAGHVLIHNTVTDVVKPLAIGGSNNDTYASLDTNEEYYGILKASVLKTQPFAAVLRAGTVNAAAAAKAVGAAITDTIKAGLPRIDFIY